jgi:hypothetical protein
MGFLKISGAEFGRRDLRRNGKHWYARPLTIEQAVDEVQIARSAASRADRKLSCQVRLGTGRKGRDLLMTDVDPLNLALSPQRIGKPVQAVADDAVDPLHARRGKRFGELIGDGLHDLARSQGRRT